MVFLSNTLVVKLVDTSRYIGMGINVITKATYLGGEIGRHAGLKILWAAMSVRVQVPPEVQNPDLMIGIFCFKDNMYRPEIG